MFPVNTENEKASLIKKLLVVSAPKSWWIILRSTNILTFKIEKYLFPFLKEDFEYILRILVMKLCKNQNR